MRLKHLFDRPRIVFPLGCALLSASAQDGDNKPLRFHLRQFAGDRFTAGPYALAGKESGRTSITDIPPTTATLRPR